MNKTNTCHILFSRVDLSQNKSGWKRMSTLTTECALETKTSFDVVEMIDVCVCVYV